MLRVAQALIPCVPDGALSFRRHPSLLLGACLLLSACGSNGFSMRQAEIDGTVLTGDVPAPAQGEADPGRTSDQATVRNAVSSADIADAVGRSRPLGQPADRGARLHHRGHRIHPGRPALPRLRDHARKLRRGAPVQGRGLHGKCRCLAHAGVPGAVTARRRGLAAPLEFLPRHAHMKTELFHISRAGADARPL